LKALTDFLNLVAFIALLFAIGWWLARHGYL
jgi:hypothetical protein